MLPGKDGELIPWKDIREITIEGETVTLLRNFERSSFEFDRRDSSQMIEIVKTWETTSHNRNRTIDDSLTVEK